MQNLITKEEVRTRFVYGRLKSVTYNSRSVTADFQLVRNDLGIEDLRYHDLRREGANRLFEQGYCIEKVAQVTGHRNLNVP